MNKIEQLAVEIETTRCVCLGLAHEKPGRASEYEADGAACAAAGERLCASLSASLGRPIEFAIRFDRNIEANAVSGDERLPLDAFDRIDVRTLCDEIAVPEFVMRRLGWWRCRYNIVSGWGYGECGEPEVRARFCEKHLPEAIAQEQRALLKLLAEADAHARRLRELLGQDV